jgi:hypothetical protein
MPHSRMNEEKVAGDKPPFADHLILVLRLTGERVDEAEIF